MTSLEDREHNPADGNAAVARSEAETTDSEQVKQLDAKYIAFKGFSEWSSSYHRPTEWANLHGEILKLANGAENKNLDRALEVMKQVAALETGALEGLYEVDSGVTITLVSQAVAWQAVLERQPAKPLIDAQLEAYDFVLDFATGRIPIAEAWIRQLHAVVCRAQTHYDVFVSPDKKEARPLNQGEYKKLPNHVQQADGSFHSYCPVVDTASEMARLVIELNSPEFATASPALQAAYAHHGFVAIHPFADGNGRVARALASVYAYRAVRVPLVILASQRTEYLDALRAADRGEIAQFCDFVERSGVTTLRLVHETVATAAVPSPLEAARKARLVNRTRGGYLHEAVDRAGTTLFRAAIELLRAEFATVQDEELKTSVEVRSSQDTGAPTGYRRTLTTEYVLGDCHIMLFGPVESRFNFVIAYWVPSDAEADDEVIVTPD